MGVYDWGRGDRFAYARYYEACTFRYNDATAGNRDFTIAAGWYYTLRTASGTWQGVPTWYKTFEDALNAAIAATASANRFDVLEATPTNSTAKYFTDAGIRLSRKAGALAWTLQFTNSEARFLMGADSAQTFSQGASTGNQLVPGRWQSPVDSCDRRKWPRREAFRGASGRTSYTNWWDGFDVRELEWKNVPASHVRSNPFPSTQAAMPALWDGRPGNTSGTEPTRILNSFHDMWEWSLLGGHPISAKYDIASMVLDPASWPAENLKPIDAAWERFGDMSPDFNVDESYRLTMKAEVIAT